MAFPELCGIQIPNKVYLLALTHSCAACISGLSLLQEMPEGLTSYPNAGVWRPVASPLEPLDAELLVKIRQGQSEL